MFNGRDPHSIANKIYAAMPNPPKYNGDQIIAINVSHIIAHKADSFLSVIHRISQPLQPLQRMQRIILARLVLAWSWLPRILNLTA